MDEISCKWCFFTTDWNSLTGENTNQCPSCENAIVPLKFASVNLESEFLCNNGGKWQKVDNNHAVCIEEDSAYKEGDKQCFSALEIVYPY